MKNKAFYFQIQVKDVTTEENSTSVFIEGFASTPDVDRYQDIVEPTAFKDALEMYMKNPVMLYQHDADRPIGNVVSATITEKGLQIRAEIKDADTIVMVKDGRMRAMSIGYIPLESTLQHEDGTPFNAEKDSVWDSSLIRVIKSLDLVEISIVSTPANGNALFTVAKSVKSYFNEMVATKSFSLSKKDAEQVEAKPVEKVEEKPVEKVEEVKPAEEKPVEKPVEEVTPTEEKQPVAPPANADEAAEPKEDAENGGEMPPADGGEVHKDEEPKADAKPAEEAAPAEQADEAKGIVLSLKTASAFPELVEAGIVVGDEKGVELPSGLVNFMQKLIENCTTQFKRAEELQEKLDKIPTKKGLAVMGQFTPPSEEKATQSENSQWFKSLFTNK